MKLILIRGLPGSGKSTRAKAYLADHVPEAKHFEADMFFIDDNGQYHFDPRRLPNAHEWCQNKTENGLKSGFDVIVSNTFVKQWEMAFYRKLAVKYQAELVIEVCRDQYQNIHDVEASVIKRMKCDWQE